ncbi:hypothetical protein GCM10009839_67200 [Catenulispora yoronensis]|uniref:Uncharacterized protein n=1 Tax=Catenulispora yoronensis TaxID=450799 RepID=A0ABP5GM61_9ACTN
MSVERVLPDPFPFRPGRGFARIGFTATDCPWSGGEGATADGPTVAGPIGVIPQVLTGRPAGAARPSGPGLSELLQRSGT